MSCAAPYVELHAHSAFSFLDGASSPLELAAAAARLDYPALALTDHDGLWGSMEFARVCKDLGLRSITGSELTVRLDGGGEIPTPGLVHLTLLVDHRRLPQPLPASQRSSLAYPRLCPAKRRAALGEARATRGAHRGSDLPVGLCSRGAALQGL